MRTRRVLVTGGFGFVGAHLCHRLVEAGHTVSVMDDCRLGSARNLARTVADQIHHTPNDILDTEAVERALRQFRPEVVVHLAAVHFIPLCDSQPRLALDVNVSGTQSVLDACGRVETVEGIVFASSGAVYSPSHEPLREESLLGPIDIYGLTKLWGEQLVAMQQTKTGLGYSIARLFNVYGPQETNMHFIPALLLQARKGDVIRLGNLATRRDYVFADDVAAALATLAANMTLGQAITCNVGAGRAFAGTEIVEHVERVIGRCLTITQDAARMRGSDRPVLLSNPENAKRALGWSASTELQEGLARALENPLAAGVPVPK